MSGNDYVKFMTQEIVKYMDLPLEERKKRKEERRREKTPVANRWFGVLPFAIKLLFKKSNKRKEKKGV